MATSTTKQDPKTSRRSRKFKGHGWSKKGSKASRKKARELARKPRFYAVARGWRPGIFVVWSNAAKQVNGYSGNVHKSFSTLIEAREFMRQHREFPPSIHTPFPPAPDTPLPPDEYVYEEYSSSESDDTAAAENADNELFVPMIQVGPPMTRKQFKSVAEIAERIVKDTENMMLDVSECPCQTCPYSRTCLMEQRFVLMRRLFQLNALLPFEHVDNGN